MIRLYYSAALYTVLGLAAGLYYRELTKAQDFVGDTQLSVVHTHLLALVVAGGDVPEHRHGGGHRVGDGAGLHDLRALWQHHGGVVGQDADELFAVDPLVLRSGEGPFAEEVDLLLGHGPGHAEVLRGGGAVGFLTDDGETLLGADSTCIVSVP